jgi:glycosyltransferase involved in cell wall biosynthesis
MQGEEARRSRRILIVSNLFPPHVIGGAEIVAYRQAQGLRARGHIVSVFAGWVASDDQKGRLELEMIDGLRVWRTPVVSFDPDDNFHVPTVVARLRSVVGREQPDVVHLHNLNGLGWSVVPLIKQLGVPVVATLHDHLAYCYRGTALRADESICGDAEECAQACRGAIRPAAIGIDLPMRLRRDYVAWALAQADRLISPSQYLATAVANSGAVDPARLSVISNGIDLAPFRALSPRLAKATAVRFLCAAYLGEHKGISDMLAAARILAAEPDLAGRWSLIIAGDGHLRPMVEAAISENVFAGHVQFLGRIPHDQMVAEIAGNDVVVLPSRWPENEPVVLLEAIAAGVATLATAVGGIPDLIDAGRTGDLIPPGKPEALAAAMATYIRDPARSRAQGAANLIRRDRFAENVAIDAVEAIHAAVCAAPAAPDRLRPLVLCAGDWPLLTVAEICNNLHRLEEPGRGIRLLWHSWAEASDWESAALFWNWSSGANHTAMQRALRAGIPILAPRSCSLAAGIERSYGSAMTYNTYLEALIVLARLPHDAEALALLRQNCRTAADFLYSTAPQESYHLPVPVSVA